MSIFYVSNDNDTSYIFSGSATGPNPTIQLDRNRTYKFNILTPGHPFLIKTVPTTGTDDVFSSGVVNNGIESGSIFFTVLDDAPDTLYYVSQNNSLLSGQIDILPDPYTPFTGSFDIEKYLDLYPSGSSDTVNLWVSTSFTLVESESGLIREEKWFWTGITIPSNYTQDDEYLDVILRQAQRVFLALPNPAPIPSPSPTPTPSVTPTLSATPTVTPTSTLILDCGLSGFIDCNYCGLEGNVICIEPVLTCTLAGEVTCIEI